MREIIIVIDVLAAIGIVVLVLLQQGKGADLGAAFGSGASGTLFGARGAANFLSRTTAILAAIFFSANLVLAWIGSHDVGQRSVTESVVTAPAKPDAGIAPVPEKPTGSAPILPPEVPK